MLGDEYVGEAESVVDGAESFDDVYDMIKNLYLDEMQTENQDGVAWCGKQYHPTDSRDTVDLKAVGEGEQWNVNEGGNFELCSRWRCDASNSGVGSDGKSKRTDNRVSDAERNSIYFDSEFPKDITVSDGSDSNNNSDGNSSDDSDICEDTGAHVHEDDKVCGDRCESMQKRDWVTGVRYKKEMDEFVKCKNSFTPAYRKYLDLPEEVRERV
uniref:Uncharacterized protein n=1 Tax=Lygus hesperus TaxID=30085 RepID=A0A0A9Z3K7_LYGHE